MKKLFIALLVAFPALASAQARITTNGKHVTMNAETGGTANIAVGGVVAFSSDGATVTNGGIVGVATAAPTPPTVPGNLVVIPTVAAGSSIRAGDCVAGRTFRYYNQGSNSIKLWPGTGVAFGPLAAGTPVIIAAGSVGEVVCTSNTAANTGLIAPLPTPTP